MSLTKDQQVKISKIGTSALTVRVQLGKFEGEELEYAISLLKKRRIDIDAILAKKKAEKTKEEEPLKSADLPELFTLPENDGPQTQEEYDALQIIKIPQSNGREPIFIEVAATVIEEQTIETTRDPLIEEEALVPVKKEKKAKIVKKTGKHEKKLYTDPAGKELTKSDLMRRLIRLKNTIKPKELNEQLIDAGFEKAYHSEIQRCRQQMGVTPEVKE